MADAYADAERDVKDTFKMTASAKWSESQEIKSLSKTLERNRDRQRYVDPKFARPEFRMHSKIEVHRPLCFHTTVYSACRSLMAKCLFLPCTFEFESTTRPCSCLRA